MIKNYASTCIKDLPRWKIQDMLELGYEHNSESIRRIVWSRSTVRSASWPMDASSERDDGPDAPPKQVMGLAAPEATPTITTGSAQEHDQQQQTADPQACELTSSPSPSLAFTIDAVSGAALGSILSYVKDFGTPHQSARAGNILTYLLQLEQDPTPLMQQRRARPSRRRRGAATAAADSDSTANTTVDAEEIEEIVKGSTCNGPDWSALRQLLYEISGDLLWHHACLNFRNTISPKMGIPDDLRDEALEFKTPIQYNDNMILKDKAAKERGYYPFAGYNFPGSEEYYEESEMAG